VSSELTGLITASYARQVAAVTGARNYTTPVEIPALSVSQAWHVPRTSTRPIIGSGLRFSP
jgi:hypothetical protein